MPLNETLFDPRRTITAGRLDGIAHVTEKQRAPPDPASAYRHWRLVTACGKPITRENLFIVLQRPEDITCPECLAILKEKAS